MSDAITDWIKTRREMEQAATEGPWEHDVGDIAQHWTRPKPWATVIDTEVSCTDYCYGGSAAGVKRDEDAVFIADARTSLPLALDALEKVLARHRPENVGELSKCPECSRIAAEEGGSHAFWVMHPCPTVTAITAALEADPR